ncbi:glycosyltransferase family 4 protein [Lyngbya confervoides]|uniref:Glycosyltransferase family 4 protein n=1 Tax=Lyngbya confervoides BDU141951 TaxID=1574623 RepID=A0ABD4T799_9CYAN|nr:glycosyltransferase family 4 protein [Lyngbya confervoides]MCM1984603.1 glycosyltransferase family 4 protein [Lyngbya confervoides BDU141951]
MNSPRLSLVHPTSNPFARNAAQALAEIGVLHEIITTTAYHPDGTIARFLQQLPVSVSDPLQQELLRRAWPPPKGVPLRSYPWYEILRLALLKLKVSQALKLGKHGPIDWVYKHLDRQVAAHHLNSITGIYAYEDGAASTFHAAKARGILCLYDLPILYYKMAQAIQREEADQFPELACSLQAIQEPEWKLQRKQQEIELADHIFVASSITQQSLLTEGISPNRITVIPYGSPTAYFYPLSKQDSTFRALFVGRVGARKGVHYLLDAWSKLALPQSELMLVGVNEMPSHWWDKTPNSLRYIDSVPHHQLNHYYSQANVFVFPSLVEGFGLVLLEAMACGIPIITTPNTAGPDIITDGIEGFIVPIRDSLALQEKIEWCYEHPTELAAMGQAARKKAEQLSWSRYQTQLANTVQSLLADHRQL